MVDAITIIGARENNLQDVSLQIPRGRITVFTGVSGSGKSSLAFDTVAAEAQRQLNETFSTFAQTRLPRYGQPDIDAIEGLSAPVVIDQRRLSGNARSTVGTITDIYALLRLLFSRAAVPTAGYANAYSFNDPEGMCPTCHGIGTVTEPDVERLVDRSRSLNDGALLAPGLAPGQWAWHLYTRSGLFDNDKKLADYSDEEWRRLLHGGVDVTITSQSNGGPVRTAYEGVLERFTRLYLYRDTSDQSDRTRATVARYVVTTTCPDCRGARLAPAALAARIGPHTIADLAAMEATELVGVLDGWQVSLPAMAPLVQRLRQRVQHLVDIGLGYLSLGRETTSLSGGESQRVKMVRHLASSLTEMVYVFDEPSIGLHARDVRRMCDLLVELRDKGNTILVVEHDPDVISVADHVVDMGPGAGAGGGHVVYQGDVAGLLAAPTLTGRSLGDRPALRAEVRRPAGWISIEGATTHNLKDLTVGVPMGVLTVVTGVAGSGKSTLAHRELLPRCPDAIVVDQSAVVASRRSNPATYTGLMDEVRRTFARVNGVRPSLFSFNSEGACRHCKGLGVTYVDLAFMDGITSTCEVCHGRRFDEGVLQHTVRGHSISDVLAMTAGEALEVLTEPGPQRVLRAIVDVGLDYLRIGQPLSSLSGGERQRIKLATKLHDVGSLYVMDEPTTGLHRSDVAHLLGIVDRLVDRGNTVVVVEHHLDVIAHADWIIDLGPEGGHRGGEVLYEGPPASLMRCDRSVTGEHLAGALTGLPPAGRPGSSRPPVECRRAAL